MKQITQKDLIKIIEEKQENAKNMFYETRNSEKDFGEAPLKKARCLAEMDTYQDLICYLNSVEIVPEEKMPPHIKAIVGENYENCFAPNLKVSDKGCVENIEPLRNDRFREFEDDMAKYLIDAKKITTIAYIAQHNNIEIGIENNNTLVFDGSQRDYNEVCDWWKYWKQN